MTSSLLLFLLFSLQTLPLHEPPWFMVSMIWCFISLKPCFIKVISFRYTLSFAPALSKNASFASMTLISSSSKTTSSLLNEKIFASRSWQTKKLSSRLRSLNVPFIKLTSPNSSYSSAFALSLKCKISLSML